MEEATGNVELIARRTPDVDATLPSGRTVLDVAIACNSNRCRQIMDLLRPRPFVSRATVAKLAGAERTLFQAAKAGKVHTVRHILATSSWQREGQTDLFYANWFIRLYTSSKDVTTI